jgi:hypothetical protein
MFNNCRYVACAFEHLQMGSTKHEECMVMAPYISSIYSQDEYITPWNLMRERKHLFSFLGGSKHGAYERDRLINSLAEIELKYDRNLRRGKKYNYPAGTYDKLFYNTSADRLNTNARMQIVQTSWDIYSSSVFCYMPGGDSPTRRAFYDAWLFGCIPVIHRVEVRQIIA